MSRTTIAIILVLVIASVGVTPVLAAGETYGIDADEQTFFQLINDYRTANGLQPLVLSRKLTIASASWSETMAAENHLYHSSTWVTRIRDTGYTANTMLGENVYMGSSYLGGATYAFNGWKSSSGHNANMLNAGFRAIGIGKVYNSARNTYYWTTDFGGVNDGDNLMTYSGGSTPTTPVPTQNHAPVLNSIGSKTVAESSPLSFTVSGSDPDGDGLTYTASGVPSGAAFSSTSRTFSWTPSSTQSGTYQVTFRVSDGSLTDSETVAITVTDTAVTVTGADSIDADELAFYNQINEYRVASGLQPLVLSTKLTAASASWSRFMAAENVFYHDPSWVTRIRNTGYSASTSLGENIYMGTNYYGSSNYAFLGWKNSPGHNANMLNANFRAIGIGKAYSSARNAYYWTTDFGGLNDGDNIMTYTGGSNPPSTPTPVPSQNHAPVLATIGSKSVAEGALLSFTVRASDPDGNTLAFTATGLPSGASFCPIAHTFTWRPTSTQAGTYRVTFRVSDGSLSDYEQVTVTVQDTPPSTPTPTVNRAPVLGYIGYKSIYEGSTLSFKISATDRDGNRLSYQATGLPSGATFNPDTRTFTWTPSYSQSGTYQVTFSVSDGSLSDSERVTIYVRNRSRYSYS
jgi:uncharacterized protein YkwD